MREKYWVPSKVHSQTCQQSIMCSRVRLSKDRSWETVLLEQAVTAWACQKSTAVHQLLLHTLLWEFSGGE